jgi:predicted nucleic acid-binding Zn ribbon protein
MLESKSSIMKNSSLGAGLQRAGGGFERIVVGALRRADAEKTPLLAWPLACGSAVASRTTALTFADGVLRVEVPDVGWRTELQGLAPQYLAILNRYVAHPVRRIEFVVAGQQLGHNGVRPARI